jgi:hypothetical protein
VPQTQKRERGGVGSRGNDEFKNKKQPKNTPANGLRALWRTRSFELICHFDALDTLGIDCTILDGR